MRITALLLGLAMLVGCGRKADPITYDLEKVERRLERVGYVSAVVGLKAAKVKSTDDLSVYVAVLGEVKAALKDVEEFGLSAFLPTVQVKLEEKLPGEEKKAVRLVAMKLLATLASEMDAKFEDRPDWKTKSEDAANMLAAFLSGAIDGIEEYGE